MNNVIEIKLDSNRAVRIDGTHLSATERQAARYAAQDAELVVDAVVWVAKKIEQFISRLFLKPSLKH